MLSIIEKTNIQVILISESKQKKEESEVSP